MNWLCIYGAKIDCKDLKIILKDEKGREVGFYRQREQKSCPLIFAIKSSKLLCKGCVRNWCYATNTRRDEEKVEDIPVVCEFRDVFPKELPGLPLQRKIDFAIELILGALPISKASYHMALTELKALKI